MASYFHFYRWLVGSYIVLATPCLIWMIFHMLDLGSSEVFNPTLVGESFVR